MRQTEHLRSSAICLIFSTSNNKLRYRNIKTSRNPVGIRIAARFVLPYIIRVKMIYLGL